MFSSSKGIQVQFTVTIPAIQPQELQFDPDVDSGSDRTEIGRGGFGIVYAGQYQDQPVAIKTLHVTTAKVVKSLYEEAAVMFRLASPYTVKLHGICSTPKVTSLVMERMMGGSLFHLLQDESQELPWELRYRLAYQIAEGLWSLHSQEILHRDLKSLNVLLDEEKHAKITDFGFSKLRGQVTSMAPSSNKQSLGTLAYKSPELIEADSDSDEEETEASAKKGMPYTPYSDIYAYGMLLWEIATRSLPFEGLSQRKIEKRIKSGNHEKIPEDCPPEFAALIKKCWAMKPGQRPRTPEIVVQTKAWYEATQVQVEAPVVPDEKDYNPESWYVHPEIRAAADQAILQTGQPYALLSAGDYDLQKVVSAYQLAPVPGKSVKSVQVIYNPRLNRKFGLELNTLNARQGKPAFKAHWREEQGKTGAWRQTTHQLLEALANPHQDTNNPHVNLVPMWHTTNADILPSLFETGFANLAMVDTGFFGKGIYSAGEAKYAQTVYGKMYARPALLMNWVASFSAYPVIDGDMEELQGKGNYGNHDAHFIPVRPANPKNPHEVNFYPCRINEKYTYTEMVVFQSAQCLPRYVVELQSDLLKSPQAILDAQQKQQAEQTQKAQAEQSVKEAEKIKAEQQMKEHAEKAKQAESAEKERVKQIEAEKAAAVKKAVEESQKMAALEKAKARADANAQAEEMKKLKEELAAEKKKLAEEKEKAAKAKKMAEKLAAEKAQVEADQKYGEQVQTEQMEKAAQQEKIQKTQAEEVQKEQEKSEQRNKAAAEENKEAETEGRIKMYSHFWKPAHQALPQVTTFLYLVAEGEQKKAKAMLKTNRRLAVESGTVTDLSKRTFKHITGFQYAVWAMDWHMWKMILKYIPIEEAALQLYALETNGTEHGKHFDLNHLIDALESYITNYKDSNNQQLGTHWCQKIGGAQLLLPAHVVNEYCHSDRSFEPIPDFTASGLSRVRTVYREEQGEAEWFTSRYYGGKLGERFAYFRAWGGHVFVVPREHAGSVLPQLYPDLKSLKSLVNTREIQVQTLKNDLLTNPIVKRAIEAETARTEAKKLATEQAQKAQAEQAIKAKTEQKSKAKPKQLVVEKTQAEQTEKRLEQERIQKAQTEEAQKEQEKAEQRNKAASEENKEADTEGRVKIYSPLWKPAQAQLPKPRGWFDFWKAEQPVQLQDNTPPQVAEFLSLVVEGEEDKAEAMLEADPTLALQSGRVTDLSKRTFQHITGFQYALWALDWNMWLMLLKYIPRDEAQLQAMALDENGTEHGKHFDFSQLLSAYETYEKNYDAWYKAQSWRTMETHWCKKVGGAQLLLPVHVINEYCRPDRAFYPLPDFKQKGLPRERKVGGIGSDVYIHQYNGGRLGVKWGMCRAESSWFSAESYLGCVRPYRFWHERAAISALSEVRLQQQQSLMKELLTNKPLVRKKS